MQFSELFSIFYPPFFEIFCSFIVLQWQKMFTIFTPIFHFNFLPLFHMYKYGAGDEIWTRSDFHLWFGRPVPYQVGFSRIYKIGAVRVLATHLLSGNSDILLFKLSPLKLFKLDLTLVWSRTIEPNIFSLKLMGWEGFAQCPWPSDFSTYDFCTWVSSNRR